MDINEPFSNMGIYETPNSAGWAHVEGGILIVKLEEIMHESDTISVIFENISTIHTTIKCVIYLHQRQV